MLTSTVLVSDVVLPAFWALVERMPEQRGHLTVHLLLSAAQAHKVSLS